MHLDIARLKEALSCMELQINKAKKLLDKVDNKNTEVYLALDAIEFDHGIMKQILDSKEITG